MGSNDQSAALATFEPERSGTEPWMRYDDQQIGTIAGFVAKASPSQARAVRVYESANMCRVEVIDAADRRLAKWNA